MIHFITVPFAILFSWYRYRFVLVDVLLKKAVYLLVIITVINTGIKISPPISHTATPLVIFLLTVTAIIIGRILNHFLDALWMPKDSLPPEISGVNLANRDA